MMPHIPNSSTARANKILQFHQITYTYGLGYQEQKQSVGDAVCSAGYSLPGICVVRQKVILYKQVDAASKLKNI